METLILRRRRHTTGMLPLQETEMESGPPLLHDVSKPELRMVLLGVAGAGKTLSGNTILSDASPVSATTNCVMRDGVIDGQKVVVGDTPGQFPLERSQDTVMKEIKEFIPKVRPHVFLILLKADDKFTLEKQNMVKEFCHTFGKNVMACTLILFTHGDRLNNRKEIVPIIRSNANLHNRLIQCHWRYHVFDNKDRTSGQVTALLEKINSIVETTGGSFYTEELLQQAEREALEEKQREQQVQNPKRAESKSVQTPALIGMGGGSVLGYLAGGGEFTSTVGAILGALAGGVGASVIAGGVMIAYHHISKCCKK